MASIPENTTLYPQWEAKHVLRYDMNGGDGQYEDSDLPADVSDTVPTRDGYEFDGWMIDGVKVDSNNTVEDNGSDVTVVAQWTPVKQDVTPTKPDAPSKDDNKTDNGGNGSNTPSKDDSKPDTPKDDNTNTPSKDDGKSDEGSGIPSKDDGKPNEGAGIPSKDDGKPNEGAGIPSDGKTDVNAPNEDKKPTDAGDNKTTGVKKSVQLAQQNDHGLASTGTTVTIAIVALVILVAAGVTLFVAKRRHE